MMLTLIGQYGNGWPILFGASCLLPIFSLIIGIGIGVWVYRDAESRGMSGALWLIISFLLSIVGLIIYLIVRKDKVSTGSSAVRSPTTRYCQYCGNSLPSNTKFCANCGREQT